MNEVEEQLDDRFKVIILTCQDARNNLGDDYEVEHKWWIDLYSKEIIENNLIEKCGEEQYFAKQLCMVNGLTWFDDKKLRYRECPHCKRVIPSAYDFNEHVDMCAKLLW